MKPIIKLSLIFVISFTITGCDYYVQTYDYTKNSYQQDVADEFVLNDFWENFDLSMLFNDTNLGNDIVMCYPIYEYILDYETMQIYKDDQLGYDYSIIFPVLESNELAGFILYQICHNEVISFQFQDISYEAVNELKNGHTIRIAFARWKIDDNIAEYATDHIFISDNNTTGSLVKRNVSLYTPPDIEYINVQILSEITIDNLTPIFRIK